MGLVVFKVTPAPTTCSNFSPQKASYFVKSSIENTRKLPKSFTQFHRSLYPPYNPMVFLQFIINQIVNPVNLLIFTNHPSLPMISFHQKTHTRGVTKVPAAFWKPRSFVSAPRGHEIKETPSRCSSMTISYSGERWKWKNVHV